MDQSRRYTCNEYRQEMVLIALKKQLQNENLSEDERKDLLDKIRQLELEMDMI